MKKIYFYQLSAPNSQPFRAICSSLIHISITCIEITGISTFSVLQAGFLTANFFAKEWGGGARAVYGKCIFTYTCSSHVPVESIKLPPTVTRLTPILLVDWARGGIFHGIEIYVHYNHGDLKLHFSLSLTPILFGFCVWFDDLLSDWRVCLLWHRISGPWCL